MTYDAFKKVRIGVAMFVAFTVSIAVSIDNIYLALAGVLIGMLFLLTVKRTVKDVMVDERIISIAGRATRATYAIVTPALALLSLALIMIGRKNGDAGLEQTGTILSYAMLFNVAVYSLLFKYFMKKYGGDGDTE